MAILVLQRALPKRLQQARTCCVFARHKSGSFTGNHSTYRGGQKVFKATGVESGPVRRCSKSYGSGQVQGGFQVLTVRAGPPQPDPEPRQVTRPEESPGINAPPKG